MQLFKRWLTFRAVKAGMEAEARNFVLHVAQEAYEIVKAPTGLDYWTERKVICAGKGVTEERAIPTLRPGGVWRIDFKQPDGQKRLSLIFDRLMSENPNFKPRLLLRVYEGERTIASFEVPDIGPDAFKPTEMAAPGKEAE